MKILYDHQAFTNQYFGGVSKCFCELITHMPDYVQAKISIKQSNNVHLLESKLVPDVKPVVMDYRHFMPSLSFRGKARLYYNLVSKLAFLHCAEQENLEYSVKTIKGGDFDVFHPTYFSDYYLPIIEKKPFVITVHDMIPELFPQSFGYKNPQSILKKVLCEKATAIIAVSNQTKIDLMRLWGVSENKINVVYHGTPDIIEDKVNRIIDEEYFLYVGQRAPYKNFTQTIRDFSLFHLKHPEVKLICTGNVFTSEEKQIIDNLNLKKCVVQIKATEKEMISLYHYAIAFIYPSLYEGFGMPILEAFSCRCPVLLNNKSCFPEIGGDAALYFDSDNGKSNLTELMMEVYHYTNGQRASLIEKGLERIKHFQWNDSSRALLDVYKKIV